MTSPQESVANHGAGGSNDSHGNTLADLRDLQALAHDAVRTLSRIPWSGSRLEAADEAIRDILATVCLAARDQSVAIERILLLLKRAWAQQPALHGLWRADTDRMLASVITQCIKEYYQREPRA